MAGKSGLRRYRGWIALGVLAVVGAVAFVLLRGTAASEQSITYETEAVASGTISVTVSGTGNVEVSNTTEVWPSEAGTVETVAVTEGSAVATGAVLLTLDGEAAEASTARALTALRQAQQSVAQAKLQVTKAEASLSALEQRSTDPSHTASAAEVEIAEADVAVAKAQRASAQAQLASAQAEHAAAQAAEDDLSVTAPCSGIVYSVEVEVGDTVSAVSSTSQSSTGNTGVGTDTGSTSTGKAPVTLAPEQPLVVHLTVNEVDLPSIGVGQRADIEFDALSSLTATGKVYEIADAGTSSSGVVTFDVWLSIDVADERLRPGMSAAATIVTEVATNTLIVSNSALNSDGKGGYYVLVIDADAAQPRQVAVETGLASATQTQILEGLTESDIVVTQTVDSAASDAGSTSPGGGIMMPGMGGGFRD